MEPLSEAKNTLARQLRTELSAKQSALEAEAETVLAAYQRAVQASQSEPIRILRGHWCYLQGQINGIGTALSILLNS